MTPLTDGRLLVYSHKEPLIDGDHALAYDIVKVRGSGIRQYWEWNSRNFSLAWTDLPLVVSADGRAWGALEMTEFSLGRTRSDEAKVSRVERVEFGDRDSRPDQWKWNLPRFVFLDSEGPVVLTPRKHRAFVISFTDESWHLAPVLQDAEHEFDFHWQWNDRILWTLTANAWKAYHFWDLGLTPASDKPFWRVTGSVEERHVSDWYRGPTPAWIPGGKAIFVSPDGRRAIVVEKRSVEGERGTYVRRLALRKSLSRDHSMEHDSGPPVFGLPSLPEPVEDAPEPPPNSASATVEKGRENSAGTAAPRSATESTSKRVVPPPH